MDDPASRVPGQLLPHMHLVSRNRYPTMHMLPTETVVDYLISAPKIVRELQPMHWTFLDGPADGTVMLTWQPLSHLGTNFASDGYVWADVEQAFTFEARGYTVEMWFHRSGYHPPNETTATHARRRYRLVPSKVPNPSIPPPDPSLWIVHYSRASQTDQIPANRIPILPQTQNMLAQRRFLQSQGQLARKDFMLHDRNNWPTIPFPPHMAPQGFAPAAPAYPSAMAGRQPGLYYPPQQAQAVVGPQVAASMKAPRGHRGSAAAVQAVTAEFAVEDEDVSTGDLMDLLSPREISKMRYQQHHEWMEEIFASPYAISQITPVSLGLGRKGELEALTAGFFDAPTGPSAGNGPSGESDQPEATKMEPAKAEDFAERVAKKVADMNAEIERMKKRHARRMEKFGRSSLLRDAEQRLRDAAADPADTGSEVWRLEGRIEVVGEPGTPQAEVVEQRAKYRVDEIVREVEGSWKKLIVPEPRVSCVSKGGLLERIEPETKEGGEGFEDGDVTMGQAESHFLDQFGTPATATSAQEGSTANQLPPSHGESTPSATPATAGNAGSAPGPSSTTTGAQPSSNVPQPDADVEMSEDQPASAAPGETGDWVMVNDESKKQEDVAKPSGGASPSAGAGTAAAAATSGNSTSQNVTPGNNTSNVSDTNLDGASFDFANIDSAGDALAAYSEQNDNDDGLDLPDLDNSAFGDAFHASDNEQGRDHHDDQQDADEMS